MSFYWKKVLDEVSGYWTELPQPDLKKVLEPCNKNAIFICTSDQ